MFLIVFGMTTAVCAALMHAAFIRLVAPRSKFVSLLFVEGLALAIGCVVLARSNVDPGEWLVGIILSVSLIGGYLTAFVGVVQDSPTLALINYILDFGPDGMPSQAIHTFVSSHPFVDSRIEAMLAAGVLELEGHRFMIGPKTKLLLRVAQLYDRLCGDASEAG